MQKKLLAVAVAGALGAPAVALAQASTVQVYGKVTFEYGYADQGAGMPNTDVLQTPGGSAIGFRGEEKLGGGLAAWFQCETSLDVNGGANPSFCTRNSALGLKGAFGNFHVGKWDTPFKRAYNIGDEGTKDTGLLGGAFLLAGSSTGTNISGVASTGSLSRHIWKRREAGQLYYESPKFSGFQLLGSVTTGDTAIGKADGTANDKRRLWSLAGVYSAGPLGVGLAYERHNNVGTQAIGAPELNDKAWVIAASYKIGPVKVGGLYIDQKYGTGAGTDMTKKGWKLGVDWRIAGPHSVQAAYQKAKDISGTGAAIGNIPAPGAGTGAKLYEIAYTYDFSKRTNTTLGYVKVKNDDNAFYTLGGLTAGGRTGFDQSAFVWYAEHKF